MSVTCESGPTVFIFAPDPESAAPLAMALGVHSKIFNAGRLSQHPSMEFSPTFAGCSDCGAGCDFWTEAVAAKLKVAGPAAGHGALREIAGKPCVVDASGETAWFRAALSGQHPTPVRAIHLVTSPIDFAFTEFKRSAQPYWLSGNIWRDRAFEMLRFSSLRHLPVLTIRADVLAVFPERTLRSVLAYLDLEFEQSCLAYWNHRGHAIGISGTRHTDPYGEEARRQWAQHATRDQVSQVLQSPGLAYAATLMAFDLSGEIQVHASMNP